MTQWQVARSVDKMNTNVSKAASFRSLENKIKSVINHEEKIISKGHETQFRRNDEKSDEIGRKYRIMKALQNTKQNSKLCQNLTAQFSKPDCLPSNCRSSDPYRSIDGCCNNLRNPPQGILMQQSSQCAYAFVS